MALLSDDLARIDACAAAGEPVALATIVAVRGSNYRRPGARMIIPAHHEASGVLSGGCLEADVATAAREAIVTGRCAVVEFDMSVGGEEIWGYGTGCQGVVEVFMEADARLAGEAFRTGVEGREASVRLVAVEAFAGVAAGAQAELRGDSLTGALVDAMGGHDAALLAVARRARSSGAPVLVSLGPGDGAARIYAERLEPPPRLLVIGAGRDAIPLVRLAASMGWRVIVADMRRAFLSANRFPEASAFVDVDARAIATAFAPDGRTSIVLMTHNYLRDGEYLAALLDAPWAYFGALGPRKRTEQLLRELGRDDALPRIHAPAGLDLGADGPEEVAWAIVSEMLAVQRGRAGGPLRDREAPIHA